MNPATDPTAPATPDPLLDRVLVRAFLEGVPDLVYFKDRESRFLAVSRSKARRHGAEPHELVGKTDADLFAHAHAQWARVDEENILSTGTPVVGKTEKITWPDGRETWARTTKLPLRDAAGEIIGTFGISEDVTATHAIELALEQTRRSLVDASRAAGMAEVATGVLHNVGNVLTSVNVATGVLATGLHQSKADSLARLAALLEEHAGDLAAFLTTDPKGRRVPELLAGLAAHAVAERDRLLAEIESLQKNIEHIKEIVAMQQAYATMVGVVEPLEPAALMDDAVRMNRGALVRHEVRVVRAFAAVPPVLGERAKVLQILVNLIRNAKYATDEAGGADKLITLRIEPGRDGHARLIVQDNGVGIPAENLEKIFQHGFTTRSGGHGFGLHSSAAAAADMHGSLTAHSDGPGRGATFTLELPLAPAGAIPTNS
jgi:PAS domain S-box-containing protein